MLDPDATVIRPVRPAPADDPDATVVRGGPAPLPAHLRRLPVALPPGFRLHEYRIDGVLGQGGFGITYLATDVNLNARVAIKEYLPEDIAFRSGDVSVGPNGSQHRDRYRLGLENFLQEARTLASFRHPAIVRVARFFEAHRTAYMVLEYEQGAPLKTWWPEHLAIGETGLVELLLPLFDGLAVVHAAGVLHRDIKPDNIQVRSADGRLVLLDFGSAGQAVAEAAGGPGAVVVTPGYAPPEQYGRGPQGPWTDVYALAATLYWCVTGRKPPDAEQRVARPGCFVAAVEACRGRFGRPFLQAIDQALSLDPVARPPDIAEFRRLLFADHLSSMGLQEALQSRDSDLPAGADGSPAAHARPRRRWARFFSPAAWPLALKMTLAMLATALLPMLLTAAWNLHGSQAAVAEAELRFVRHLAASTAGRLAQFVADSRHLAKALGSDLDFVQFLSRPDDGERAPMREKLVRQVAANPDVQLIMLMDRHGSALISSDPQVEGRNFAFRQYFQEAMAGRPAMTGLTVGAVAGASGMFYAEPVKGEGGEVLGAVVLRMRGSSVAAILDAVGRDQALTPFLIDGDGVLIHHPRPEFLYRSLMPLAADRLAAIKADQRFRRDTIQSLDQPVLAAAMVGARAVGDVSYNSHLTNRPEIAGFAPVDGHDWVVGVSESRDRFEEPLARLFRNLLWSVLAAGLLFAWLALRFARGIVRPIQDLTRAAHALKAGDFGNATVSVQRRDEVGQLARTFNVMIDVLRQRERERER